VSGTRGAARALEAATAHQPRARAALTAALASGPSHAYLFRGPRGSGKAAAARAFTAEIIAAGCEDPADARRRALQHPSPHPDLVWLEPRGTQHLVDDVRERVIGAVALRPFEAARRVFVIEAAEAMRDESQNALLKTLEEPPAYAHLILLSAEPEALLETISSRCQAVTFAALPAAAIAEALEGGGPPERVSAAANLAAGDLERARFLLSEAGEGIRTEAESCAEAALAGTLGSAPWSALLSSAEAAGEEAEAVAREALEAEKELGVRRSAKEAVDEARRAGRRRRTEVLDLGLELCAVWLRDLVAVCAGAEEIVFNRDRLDRLRRSAEGLDPARARQAVELVSESRRRLDLNVSEELALEALFFRLEALLAPAA
jgi:DNA polymerase III subunit delta'